MKVYFIYSADFYDRSVGTVLLNNTIYDKKQFKALVKTAKERTDGLQSSIVEYLKKHYEFEVADIPNCNIENV